MGRVMNGIPIPITEKKQVIFSVKWVIKLLRDKNRIITSNGLIEL